MHKRKIAESKFNPFVYFASSAFDLMRIRFLSLILIGFGTADAAEFILKNL